MLTQKGSLQLGSFAALLLFGVTLAGCSRPQTSISGLYDTLSIQDEESGGVTNARPIIGILTLPGGEVLEDESYISAGYVKWIEAAGARVVPIFYDLSHSELTRMFKMVNGLLIPGGNYPLKPTTTWYKAASFLYDLAIKANDQRVYFPIQGTCLGLQLLVTLVSKDEYALSSVDAHDHPSKLLFTSESKTSTFLKGTPQHVLEDLQNYPIAMHNHQYGLLPEALVEYPALGSFYKVLAYTQDRKGVKYATIVEASKYPFTGFGFHPEKLAYDWTTSIHMPRSRKALDAAYFLAQAFVDRARKNEHKGADIMDEDAHLIYNWSPVFSGKHQMPADDAFFEQIYVFPDGQRYPQQRQHTEA